MTIYASDSFNRANGAVGVADVGGQTWTRYRTGGATPTTTWTVTNNQLVATVSPATDELLVVDTGQADGVVSGQLVTTAAAKDLGLVFRCVDGTKFWMVWVSASNYKLMLYNGSYTTVATASPAGQAPTDVVAVTLAGSSITVTRNGSTVMTATDSTFSTATQHGFRSFGNGAFDNFSHADTAQVLTNTVAPAITGTAQVGSTLTASNGTWSATPDGYTYQWNRAGSPISGATASTYAPVSGDVGSTLTVTVTASKSGYQSGTATSSATATVAAASTGTIAPTNANIVYSPYTWNVVSGSAQTIYGGAYLRVALAGSASSIVANFDTSATSAGTVTMAIRVDNEPVYTASVAATVTIPIPTNNWPEHTVEIIAARIQGGNKWNSPPTTSIKFTGFTVSPNTVSAAITRRAPYNVLCYGDSILEGYQTYANAVNESRLGWGYPLRGLLGAEVGIVGLNAQGLTSTGEGNVPVWPSSYNLLWAGVSRSFTSPAEPNLVLINMGTNDTTTNTTTAATTVLNGILAATVTTPIVVIQQWKNTSQKAFWQAAISACTAPTRVTYLDTAGWLSSSDTSDTTHPYGYINLTDLSPRIAAAVGPLLTGSSGTATPKRFINKAGAAVAIG
jgi:lysophospholipase L1-like esterase